MIATKSEYDRAAERVWSAVEKLERGDTLTHITVQSITRYERHSPGWKGVLSRVRKRVRDDRGIEMWPEPEVGYRLLTLKEQVEDLPRWRETRATRQRRRARKALEVLPVEELSDHQRQLRIMQLDAIEASMAETRLRAQLTAAFLRGVAV